MIAEKLMTNCILCLNLRHGQNGFDHGQNRNFTSLIDKLTMVKTVLTIQMIEALEFNVARMQHFIHHQPNDIFAQQ